MLKSIVLIALAMNASAFADSFADVYSKQAASAQARMLDASIEYCYDQAGVLEEYQRVSGSTQREQSRVFNAHLNRCLDSIARLHDEKSVILKLGDGENACFTDSCVECTDDCLDSE